MSGRALSGNPGFRVRGNLPLPFWNRIREKRWCYAGIVHPRLFFGCAVVHLGYVTSAFCYFFDRESGTLVAHDVVRPPLGAVRFDRSSERVCCRFRSRGFTVEIAGRPADGPVIVRSELNRNGKTVSVDARMTGDTVPVPFGMPMGGAATALTVKAAGFDVRGRIRLNGESRDMAEPNGSGLFDWTHGFYPRDTFWNWACGAGTAGDGTRIGFNFSRGVYENGELENVIWFDGRPERIGPVRFAYQENKPEEPWQITAPDGRADLTFFPEGIRRGNENLGIIQSRFIQPCGGFIGTLRSKTGRVVSLAGPGGISGVVEEHTARW